MSLHYCILLLAFILAFVCFHGVQSSENSRSATENDVSLIGGWGLPDSIAVVGKLFHYPLPRQDTVCGNFTNYQVSAAGSADEEFPSWLSFNKLTSSLEGIPGPGAIRQIRSMQVTAVCIRSADGSLIPVKDHFTIKVTDKEPPTETLDNSWTFESKSLKKMTSPDDIMIVRCGADSSVTTATVTIDADESLLSAADRVSLLRNVSSHLGLPELSLRLSPYQERPTFDDSALVAGPGDTNQPTHAGIIFQWDVGCGNVYAEHMPILELLEVSSINGTMGKAVGHGVVGWHVTSKKLIQRRMKRRISIVNPTATLMPSVTRPSVRPVPTSTVSDTDTPESRVIPTTKSSVVVPGPTRTQPPEASIWPHTSKIKPSKLTKSPTPTTTYVTITPTRVLSTMTSPATSTASVIKSTTPSYSSVDLIEPSITSSIPVKYHSTEILPGWSTSSIIPSALPTPKVTKRPPKTSKPVNWKTTSSPNKPPVVSKPLPVIDATVGIPLVFEIPADTFNDDGGVENLIILFLDEEDKTVDPLSWIKLNQTSRTLYGLPMDEHKGMHAYKLAAIDKSDRSVKAPCNIFVKDNPARDKRSNEFSVTFDLDYEKVINDLSTRMNLINKIAAAFGDRDSSKMTITKIAPGSVIISWANNTIPSEPCPDKVLEGLLRYLLLPNGEINETFVKAMEPYRVLKAEGSFEACGSFANSTISPVAIKTTTLQLKISSTPTTVGDVDVKPRLQKADSLLLYILLPLLIFFFLLLLLIIICVVCYKRQRKRQKEQDKLNGLHKGIPIIFADELDEKQDTPASTLKSRRSPDEDDKQSVPPPEYPSSKPGSRSSTLRSDYKSPLISDNEDDMDSRAPETLPRQRVGLPAGKSDQSASTTTPLLHFNA